MQKKVRQALPPPKEIGTGNDYVCVEIITKQLYENRPSEEEMEIKNYASKLGTLKGIVQATNDFKHLIYKLVLLNANCTKVDNWINDVVNSSPKTFEKGTVECKRNLTRNATATVTGATPKT
nr:unnamed protein product [Haemonchus contortus]CDJ96742.1 unnamed protein product [Haemonchus contortus]